MLWPSAFSSRGEFGHQLEGLLEGLDVGDLAADMHVDAGHIEAGQGRGAGIDLRGAGEGNAEFIVGLAGGDLGMGLGIDIGIDADGNGGALAGALGHLREQFQFRL